MKRKFVGLLMLVSCTFASLEAQEELGYQVPNKALLDMVDIDLAPYVLSNSDNSVLVMLYRPTYKSIKTLSRKELRIAGLRVDPQRFIGSRTTYYNKVTLVDLSKGKRLNPLWVFQKILNCQILAGHLMRKASQ